MTVFYEQQPEKVMYMPLPDGQADVWIREGVRQVTDEDGTRWAAEEVYLRTRQTKEEITRNADTIFFTQSGIAEKLTAVVQDYMDKTVQQRGYDNIQSACSYANSTDTIFRAEGLACLAWRDNCWRKCYEIQAAVVAGTHSIPTAEELVEELPELIW